MIYASLLPVCREGRLASSALLLAVVPVPHELLYRFYTFNSEIEERRSPGEEKEGFAPQNIPLSCQETASLGPRNPPQRVPAHKDDGNVERWLELSSNPPQGPGPPFNSGEVPPVTPAPGSGFD